MITTSLLEVYRDNLHDKMDQSDKTFDFGGRVYNLGKTAITFVSCTADLCIGSGAAVLAIGTLGRVKGLNHFALEELITGGHVVTKTYRSFLQIINPSAEFYRTNIYRGLSGEHIKIRQKWVTIDDDGIVNDRFQSYFFDKIENNVSSQFLKGKLKGITIIASTASFILDFPISLIGATGSILTGGRFKLINTIGSCHGLDVLGQITNIFYGTLMLLNNDCI